MTADNFCQAVLKERWPSLKSESYKELYYIQKLQMPLHSVPNCECFCWWEIQRHCYVLKVEKKNFWNVVWYCKAFANMIPTTGLTSETCSKRTNKLNLTDNGKFWVYWVLNIFCRPGYWKCLVQTFLPFSQ